MGPSFGRDFETGCEASCVVETSAKGMGGK